MIRMLINVLRFLASLLLIRFLLRALAAWLQPRPARPNANERPRLLVQDLVRDRVCNTFVARDRAIRAMIGGRESHFCSPACRDKALALARAAS